MPPKQKDIQVPVKNDAHWEQLISPDNPRLVSKSSYYVFLI